MQTLTPYFNTVGRVLISTIFLLLCPFTKSLGGSHE